MVDVTEFVESNFVKPEVAWDKKVVVIVTEPGWVTNTRFGDDKKQLVCDVQADGKTYKWGINRTNAKTISKAVGSTNTSAWVGKKFKLNLATIVVNGQVRQTLVASAEPLGVTP